MRNLDILRILAPLSVIVVWFFVPVGGVYLLGLVAIAAIGFIVPTWRYESTRRTVENPDKSMGFKATNGNKSFEWGFKDWLGLAIMVTVGYAIVKGTDPITLLQTLMKGSGA